MATLSHQQSRRMYSWWWDSHISPKNSKWLQENLTDMDTKVKQMIKLIEEDADSFARRAEMYYKKRPELMRLVEEFYRAYRALAERYDNATGVIRQAHRTMAEAFPNQVPLMADDSPAGSGASEGEPRTPEMTPPTRALLDPDELHQDASGLSSSHFHAVKRNGAFTEEPDSVAGRKGLKQHNNLFGSGEETQSHAKSAEGRARKGLNFHDAEAKEQTMQTGEYQNSKTRALSESEQGDKFQSDILILKEALAKLEAEKDAGLLQYQKSVERLSKLESEVVSAQTDSRGLNDRASQAEAEVQALKESLTKLEAEREASFLQYQQCLDRISNLESNILRSEENAGELNERVRKAENEAQAAKHALSVMEAEKEAIFVQYNECLEKISDLEKKLLEAEDDVRRINKRADKAETEVETLKQALGKVEEEKKATSLQYQQCLETISSLECKLASAQEEAQRLNSEIGDGVAKLKGAEEHFLRLETSNQSLQSELELLVQKMGTQSQELSEKQKELGRLWTCIQEERMRFMEAELAFQALQNLHSRSQEELRALVAELQNRAQVLKDLEIHNQGLHDEVQKVKEENKSLNILNLSSVASIKNMQDQLAGVRETNGKLQGEVELRVDQRNALQQEIYCLKEEINDLNKKHRDVLQQVDSVGLNPECLGSSVKELQEENSKLNEIFQRERSEKIALLEKLEIMEKLLEKNAFLENSLSNLNAEFEAIRGKVNGLEESCQLLLDEKSALVAENTTLFSQLKTTAENLGNISEKNAILENSLFDANAELEGFRAKVKSLEDSCQLLETEKSGLITEKESLVSELQISQHKLEELERRFTELEEKHSSLGREKESTLCKVEELRVALDVEKEEQAKLTQLSETRLAGLISQICLLQEEGWHRKKEFEEELDKAVNAQIEIFILQKFVKDLKENNYSLFVECQKLLQASKLSEKLVSKFQHENLEQQVEVKSLFDQMKKMRMWMHQVLKALDNNSDQGGGDKTEGDQILMDRILGKLEDKESSLSEALDENQKLVLEKSVLCTLLGQLRLEAANLEMEKNTLYQDLRTRTQEFLTLRSENHKLITMVEELKLKISDNVHKNVIQMTEIENLHANLLDLQGAYQNLQYEHSKVLEENGSLMKELSDAKEENYTLQEENHVISCEGISFNYLSLIFQNTVVEKSVELEELGENLDNEIAYGKDLSHQKEVELLEAEEKVIALQNEQIELQNLMEHLKREFDEVKGLKEDQEKQIHKLYEEVDNQNKKSESLCGLNQRLEVSLLTLQKEYEETRVSEESLSSELAKWRNEAEQWETEAAEFFSELQISAIHEALFSEKLCELTEACQSLEDKSTSNVMEIDLLKERVGTLEDKNGGLKAQLDGYIPAFDSLRGSIVSLENYTLQNLKLYETENEQAKAESCGERNEDLNVQAPDGFSYLQELETRIKAIEKALMKTESLAAQDKLKTNMKFEEAMKQIELLKSGSGLQKDNSGRGRLGKHGGELHDNSKPRKSVNEISETGNELLTKDIMLDQMSECTSYGKSRREIVEADGQMLELWETTDQNDSIDLKVGKAKKASADPTMHQQMKVVRKGKSRDPSSEILVEKELGVDKLEISKRFVEPRQEGNKKKILERLASDAQKLTNLQITVEDLKRKVEINEKSKKGKGIEYGSVKEQLEETEEAILKLFDINNKLTKNVEDDSISSEEKSAGDLDERESTRRRKVSEQARRGSEKIGRLQLEVQKLQFLLLKLDDERESKGKTRIPGHKTRVLLRDYLYGGRRPSTHKQKKTRFCACVQPPTKGD